MSYLHFMDGYDILKEYIITTH